MDENTALLLLAGLLSVLLLIVRRVVNRHHKGPKEWEKPRWQRVGANFWNFNKKVHIHL